MVNLNDLRVFATVVAVGSISQAAELLDIDKSSVSRYLIRLEEEIGQPLLERTTRKVLLTAAGSDLYERCVHFLSEVAESIGNIGTVAVREVFDLLAVVPQDFADVDLASLVAAFQRRRPSCRLAIERQMSPSGPPPDVLIQVSADFSYSGNFIGSIRRCLCASPEYLERHGFPKSATDLINHDFVDCSEIKMSTLESVARVTAKPLLVKTEARYTVRGAQFAQQLVLAGVGIGALNRFACEKDLSDGKLVPVLPSIQLPPLTVSLQYPSQRRWAPNVKQLSVALTNWLEDLVGPRIDGVPPASEST